MSPFTAYRLRLRRKAWLARALVKSRELDSVTFQFDAGRVEGPLLFGCLRNEAHRLPWFLRYYRQLGISHFFLVNNGSTDATSDYLKHQSDVSLWFTSSSYRKARFGADWLNALRTRYGHGHWCLTVDADEHLVYPNHETRPLKALTEWLDARAQCCFHTLVLDMYPKGNIEDAHCPPGADPVQVTPWFDEGNYRQKLNATYGNPWVQGGARERVFFPETPQKAPALNKIPLVKWKRGYVYASSAHMLLPRRMNRPPASDWPTGCLLHTKFHSGFGARALEEVGRKEHYAGAKEYQAYLRDWPGPTQLWTETATRYRNWHQLAQLGLLNQGIWT